MGYAVLEVKIGDDMCVKLVAHRLTSLALKKQMKFEKESYRIFRNMSLVITIIL